MAPRRKVSVSKAPPVPKRARSSRGASSARGGSSARGASTSQAPSQSELRSKRRNDRGNIPQPSHVEEEEEEEEEDEDVGEETQSKLPLSYFGNEHRRIYFYKNYHKRKIHETKRVDFQYMGRFRLRVVDWLKYQKWDTLLADDDVYYPTLVQVFHSNFNSNDFSSYVKGVPIDFGDTDEKAYEALGVILGVPYQEDPLPDEVDVKFIFNELTNSQDHFAATTVIKANAMSQEARILRSILASCILPKVGSKDSVTQKEAELLWRIMHCKKVNLPKEMFRHIIACNKDRKNLALPYGTWLTSVFKFFGVSLRNETSLHLGRRAVIGETSIKLMEIDVLALQVQREDEERAEFHERQRDRGREEGEEEREAGEGEGEGGGGGEQDESGDEDTHSGHAATYSFQRRAPAPTPPDIGEATSIRPDPSILSFLQSFQTTVMSEFQSIHSTLARVIHRQDDLEARILSISAPASTPSVPASTAPPPAPPSPSVPPSPSAPAPPSATSPPPEHPAPPL